MSSNIIQLAWQLYRQERQYRYEKVLSWVQAVLLVFVITLSMAGGNIQHYLENNLQNLLGADVVLVQNNKLGTKHEQQLQQLSNNTAMTQEIRATLSKGDNWQQVTLRAYDENYPIHGDLLTRSSDLDDTANRLGEKTHSGPKPGEIWLDTRLTQSLAARIGDSITLANKQLNFSRILIHEPDRLTDSNASHMRFNMRAIINSDDFIDLGFPNDQVLYRYLIDAGREQIEEIIEWQSKTQAHTTLRHRLGAHPLASFWKRVENFLGLASILLFFLAAVAISQLSQIVTRKEKQLASICMSLGASKIDSLKISIFKWLIGIIFLISISCLASLVTHFFILYWLGNILDGLNWSLDLYPVLTSLVLIFFILLAFRIPVWINLLSSSVIDLFRDNKSQTIYLQNLLGISSLFLPITFYSDNIMLSMMISGALVITVIFLLFISWVGLTTTEKIARKRAGLIAFTLYMMKQRLYSKTAQILGIGLSTFLLLFTLVLLQDLSQSLSAYKREHDGNLFISKATAVQMQYVRDWATDNDITALQDKPFFFATLHAVNDRSLETHAPRQSESLSRLKKPIRLHLSNYTPENNVVKTGQWWTSKEEQWQKISVEEEVMTDLSLSLGDTLLFYINSQAVKFEIVASHAYIPGAGSITFWFQMPEAAEQHLQAQKYFMGSMELADHQWSLLSQLWKMYPSLNMASLDEITKRFDHILSIVVQAIIGFTLFLITFAVLVVLASTIANETRERKKNGIILSFGFDKRMCLKLNALEWLVTAVIAGVGATIGACIAGLLIYQSQFSMPYAPDPIVLISTLAAILIAVLSIGLFANRASLAASVKDLIAES